MEVLELTHNIKTEKIKYLKLKKKTQVIENMVDETNIGLENAEEKIGIFEK